MVAPSHASWAPPPARTRSSAARASERSAAAESAPPPNGDAASWASLMDGAWSCWSRGRVSRPACRPHWPRAITARLHLHCNRNSGLHEETGERFGDLGHPVGLSKHTVHAGGESARLEARAAI